MMSTLVEAMARAIVCKIQLHEFGRMDEEGNFVTSGKQIELLDKQCTAAALAALKAMKEHGPTSHMNVAGHEAVEDYIGRMIHEAFTPVGFTAMLQAAIDEAQP